MEGLDVVKAGQHAGAAVRNVGPEGRQIRAHVAHQVDVHGQEFAVLGQRHPRRGDVVAALRVAHEMIGAISRPFDGAAQLARGDRDQRVFAIGKQFGAEPAADIRTDHPHLLDRDLQHILAQDIAQAVAALAADRQRQMIPLGVVFADHRAGFHEIGDDARIDDRDFGHRMGLRERSLGRFLVADRHVEQHIACMLGPDLWRALLHRIGKADHRRQRRPVDLDGLDRVAGLIDGVRDHEGYGIADMPHHTVGENGIGRAGERIDFQVEQAGQPAEILDVFRRQDRADARQALGAGGIDGELGMGVRRAQHQRMHRSLRRVIIGVAALAANERVIFLAKDALTDAELDGSSHRISSLQIISVLYCSGSPASANRFRRGIDSFEPGEMSGCAAVTTKKPRTMPGL